MHPQSQEDHQNDPHQVDSNNLLTTFSNFHIHSTSFNADNTNLKNDSSFLWSPFSYTSSINNNNIHIQHHQQQNANTWSPTSSSSEVTPTDSEIQRRALAATGLNVSAPEFIPSYISACSSATTPTTTPQLHQPLSPNEPSFTSSPYENSNNNDMYNPYPIDDNQYTDNYIVQNDEDAVYSNVTQLISLDNDFASFLHEDNAPVEAASLEDAVNHFDAQFPALQPSTSSNQSSMTTSNQSLFPQALGWDALRREQELKRRTQLRLAEDEEKRRTLEAIVIPNVNVCEETPITKDVGDLWVPTGKSVADLYEELRSEAAQAASFRNKCFDRAAAAFRRNDGATAKKLGAQGREANERMKALHRKAANAIFAARNPAHSTNIVDLHGLHVSEALERLPGAIERATADKIRILTGTGHHTKGTGRARLRPAVKKWLHENHYFFEEVIDANEHVGSFVVEVKK